MLVDQPALVIHLLAPVFDSTLRLVEYDLTVVVVVVTNPVEPLKLLVDMVSKARALTG